MRTYRKRNARGTRRQKGGNAELMTAVRNGNYDLVQRLLDAGTNVNYVDLAGITPLMVAVRENEYDDDANIVQSLLAAGANVNYRDRRGDTPLSEAIRLVRNIRDDPERVKFNRSIQYINQLIGAGADVNARNGDGYTPLLQVLFLEMGTAFTLPIVQALIAAGADVNLPTETGRRPIEFAINEVRDALLAVPGIILPPGFRMPVREPVQAPEQPRRQGFAVEVHDAYDKINKDAFLGFMEARVGAVPELPDDTDMPNYIYNTMKLFMTSLAANSQPKKTWTRCLGV